MSRPLLELSGVSKRFSRRTDLRLRYAIADAAREFRRLPPRDELREGEFWAIRDVDLRVDAGEVVGVIGHNGAGKSTLMQVAAGILMPTTGTVTAWTRDICRIDQLGVISPFETGRENILMQLALHRVPSRETAAEIEAIGTIADLHDRLDDVVSNYSTGMRGRLGFAIYARLRPDLLLVDEGIGGGDRRFRDRFRGFIEEYVDEGGAMLFAMHDTNAITTLCDRVVLLEEGRVVLSSDPATAIDAYNELAARKGVPPLPQPRRHHHEAQRRAREASAAAGGSRPRPAADTLSVELSIMPGDPPRPGGRIEFEVAIRAAQPVANAGLALLAGRGDLFPLAKSDGPALAIAAGVTRLRCVVGQLPFFEGLYDVRAALIDRDARRPLAQSEPLALKVSGSADAGTRKGAIVRLEASWNEPENDPTGLPAEGPKHGSIASPPTAPPDATSHRSSGGRATEPARDATTGDLR